MLKEVMNNPDTYFNPYMFITDEAGANYNGILKVYGQEGYRKSRTCIFHFKQALTKMLDKFPATLLVQRNEFEELMLSMLKVATISEFVEIKTEFKRLLLLSLQSNMALIGGWPGGITFFLYLEGIALPVLTWLK